MASRALQLIDQVHVALNDSSVKAYYGQNAIKHHAGPRRAIWVRAPGRFDTAKTKGTATVLDHFVGFWLHIYAEDDEKTEALLYALVAAICATVPPGSREIGSDRWRSQEEGEAGEVLRTEKVILPVFFRLPVPSTVGEPQTRVIVAVEDVCGTIQPDGSVVRQDEVP